MNLKKEKYWDYFILVSRFLIAMIFLDYGYGKLMGNQFGISESEMATQVKDLDLFKLSWYLFEKQPFRGFIGVAQIICGILLIINRTAILGAFLFLPIVATILIIDLTFMPKGMATDFAWRLSFYMLLDFMILWHYKDKMKIIWHAVWQDVNTKFKIPIWGYLLLPIMAIGLELIGFLPKMIVMIFSNPHEFWNGLKELIDKMQG
jgi:uncharacterized membrane protein YphA (DoxX/SURF4 family)